MSVGTRLRLEPDEAVLLHAIEEHLSRARAWDLPFAQRQDKANDRMKRLVAKFEITSRYAGSICVDNDAAVRAAKEHLWADQVQLQAAIGVVTARVALPSKELACGCRQRGCEACGTGYRSERERVMKRQRLDVLRTRLTRVQAARSAKQYSVCLGGRQHANTRHHLPAAGRGLDDWQATQHQRRAWFGCVGNKGALGGNPCLSLRQGGPGQWLLTVSVPGPVQRTLNAPVRVQLTHPVPLAHHRVELEGRLHDRLAVRLDLHFEPGRRGEKARVRIAWVRAGRDALTLQQARLGGLVGVDLNEGHLDAARLDQAGNPVGAPVFIPLLLAGLPTSTRDARLRHAITELLTFALTSGARAIAIEDLGFRAESSREKHGRNKKFRKLLSGFPTAAFRERLVAMATTAGLTVIAVDPRYTSKVGGRDWEKVLGGGYRGGTPVRAADRCATNCATTTSASRSATPTTTVTRHCGAAVAIGRRALALGLKAGPRPEARKRPGPPGPQDRSVTHRRSPNASSTAALRKGRQDGSTPGVSDDAGLSRATGTPQGSTQRTLVGAHAAHSTAPAHPAPIPTSAGHSAQVGRGSGGRARRADRTPLIGSAAPPQPPG